MSLRRKLVIGLGFLFLIIFSLVMYSSFQIQALSKDARAIIKDNYDSLVYCKGMLVALDDMRTIVTNEAIAKNASLSQFGEEDFAKARSDFEANLAKEKSNITEVHEADYVSDLGRAYEMFLNLSQELRQGKGSLASSHDQVLSAYVNARQAISRINDVNMEAIQRKNEIAATDANAITTSIVVVGAICLILAFFYFWYFPFYVSNSLSYLTDKMRGLLVKMGIKIDTQTKDETFILLHSINLLENALVKEKRARRHNKA
jgi:NtrC-family two-component system sensor histidine kinase KinB